MPNIIEIADTSLPQLDVFARLTEGQLRSRLEPEKGIFIAESPKVIERALDAGYEPVSLLMERKHISGQGRDIIARCGDIPVYTADREVLAGLTGGSFPFSAFLSGALFTAVPGIVAQLVLIPLLLTALQKGGFAD